MVVINRINAMLSNMGKMQTYFTKLEKYLMKRNKDKGVKIITRQMLWKMDQKKFLCIAHLILKYG